MKEQKAKNGSKPENASGTSITGASGDYIDIDKLCQDIHDLKIQGARNVARAAVDALGLAIQQSKAKKKEELVNDILVISDKIAGLRATEPMLDNLLRFFTQELQKEKTVEGMKIKHSVLSRKFASDMDKNIELILGYGSNLIREDSIVLTHCHSSTVEKILVRAHEIKKIKVICTETRPLYQGRITARNLARQGLDVTMITDSAVASRMKDIDIAIVGADVITAQGQLVNKIGTSMVAATAYEYQTPFYSAAELWKYDPMTKTGFARKIEERDRNELLSDLKDRDLKEFEKVKILNPAFDITPAKYINSFITEKGLISPQDISNVAEAALKEMLK